MNPMGPARRRTLFLLLSLAAGAALAQPGHGGEQRFPDVIAVQVRTSGANLFDFDVTISSPYDTPRRYADGFRILTLDNVVLAERKLLHDHQDEQPFTRDLYAVGIPPNARRVRVQARDQRHGYGGKILEVVLPGR